MPLVSYTLRSKHNACTHAHAHAHTHSHTHAHIHMHTHMHTHTHTHTHTYTSDFKKPDVLWPQAHTPGLKTAQQ